VRDKDTLGLKQAGRAQGGSFFGAVGSSNGACFSKAKAPRQRGYRSNRFGSTDEEWEICKSMVEMRSEGYSYGRIADALNREGIETKRGNPWNYYTARFVTLRAKEEMDGREG
jgi:hypothetical protein|tara:strand:- start:528 stop:866 length:339 start_codon:yes stop_codon:yes gene_type:complete